MISYAKGLILSIILFVAFVVLYYLMGRNGFIIDDGVLMVSQVFLGFIHWIYAWPLYKYLKKKHTGSKSSQGFLLSSQCISVLNILLLMWILADPSTFFWIFAPPGKLEQARNAIMVNFPYYLGLFFIFIGLILLFLKEIKVVFNLLVGNK